MASDMAEAAFFRVQRRPRPSLARHVECVWAARTADDGPLLPDAAVELVWSGTGLFVRGADTRPHAVSSFPERTFVVVRFRPGAAAAVLGLHGNELSDARVGVSALWGLSEMERLESRLAECDSSAEAADVLEHVVAARVRELPDSAVEAVVAELRAGEVGIADLARRIGVSERQLRRRCTSALGYGPKTLGRILRFQRFRALAATRGRWTRRAGRVCRIRRSAAPHPRVRTARRGDARRASRPRLKTSVSFKTAPASSL